MKNSVRFIIWTSEVSCTDTLLVGGKAANVGELYRNLVPLGIRVPNGFIVTTEAWRAFIKANPQLPPKILSHIALIDYADEESLKTASSRIWDDIIDAKLPNDLCREIASAYHRLEKEYKISHLDVAVRSFAVMEDLKEASFAGQHATFLNRRRADDVISHIKKCFASLFTPQALSYRHEKGLPAFPEDGIAVLVQKMVHSNWACSGLAFSHESVSTASYLIQIDAGWGLGELVVSGQEIIPDRYLVAKPYGSGERLTIVGKDLGEKAKKMVYEYREQKGTYIDNTTEEERSRFCLSDEEILEIARMVAAIEKHYLERDPDIQALDIEWAKDGDGVNHGTGKIFIVQVRATTFKKDPLRIEKITMPSDAQGAVLCEGIAASPGAGQGPVRVIEDVYNSTQLREGEILVTRMTSPDWVPAMRRAAAIITDEGGRNCHAAIVAREMQKPCIVGAGRATEVLRSVEQATVNCTLGTLGKVYQGLLPLERYFVDLRSVIEMKQKIKHTQIMLILADPYSAPMYSFYPNDGIGLARWEFVIANMIGVHPRSMLASSVESTLDREEFKKLRQLARGYSTPLDFFIWQLAYGTAQLAAAVRPNPIIVRFSDFKTNEYAQLLGGKHFEPYEENPMLGLRGASRYYDPRYGYEEAFRRIECAALRIAREELGFLNIKAMIPFCRTVEEARRVIEVMQNAGLIQGRDGFEVYCMTEIPSNVILFEKFAEIFDGFSIGSNDLTQLTLGLDRDSGELAHIANERNEAVLWMIATAIEKAKICGKPIGICGQAPSNYPEFAEWLVNLGISSISVNPDAIPTTIENVLRAEQKVKGSLGQQEP